MKRSNVIFPGFIKSSAFSKILLPGCRRRVGMFTSTSVVLLARCSNIELRHFWSHGPFGPFWSLLVPLRHFWSHGLSRGGDSSLYGLGHLISIAVVFRFLEFVLALSFPLGLEFVPYSVVQIELLLLSVSLQDDFSAKLSSFTCIFQFWKLTDGFGVVLTQKECSQRGRCLFWIAPSQSS